MVEIQIQFSPVSILINMVAAAAADIHTKVWLLAKHEGESLKELFAGNNFRSSGNMEATRDFAKPRHETRNESRRT